MRKWRLQPGKMLLIDLEAGPHHRGRGDQARRSPTPSPTTNGWTQTQFKLEELPDRRDEPRPRGERSDALLDRQQAFGYTQEDMQFFLEPMATARRRSGRLDGHRHAASPCSRDRPKLLYDYFKQNFAQVTNPPIDPIREELVMSLVSMIGPRPNLLGRQAGTHKRLEVAQPILTNADLEKIRSIDELLDGAFRTATIDTTWPAADGADGPGARRSSGSAARRPRRCWPTTTS